MGLFPIFKGEKKNARKTGFVYPAIDTSGMTFDSCTSGAAENAPGVPGAGNPPAVKSGEASSGQQAEGAGA